MRRINANTASVRDQRADCVQLVIGLIVTPEGFPLAYEVLAGNTSDKTTLEAFLERIETQYGQAQRVWVMDRGIPTEKVLEKMRKRQPPDLLPGRYAQRALIPVLKPVEPLVSSHSV
jgi:Transposase DDE domain